MGHVEDMGDVTVSFSEGTRMLFYLMSPNETSFADVEQVPQYVKQVGSGFILQLWHACTAPTSIV